LRVCGVAVVGYACSLADTFIVAFDAAELFHAGHFLDNVAVFVSAVLRGIEV